MTTSEEHYRMMMLGVSIGRNRHFNLSPDIRLAVSKEEWQGFCVDLAQWRSLEYLAGTNYDDLKWARFVQCSLPPIERFLECFYCNDVTAISEMKEKLAYSYQDIESDSHQKKGNS